MSLSNLLKGAADKADTVCTLATPYSHKIKAQGFGFVNAGAKALTSRQCYACFLRIETSQRIKGKICGGDGVIR